jgi:hypothetical protein
MKEAWKRQRDGSNTSTGFIVQAGAMLRGTPARELEPMATHKLVLDIGASGKVPGRSLRDTVAGQPRKVSCSSQLISAQLSLASIWGTKVNNCPFVSLWGWVRSFQ